MPVNGMLLQPLDQLAFQPIMNLAATFTVTLWWRFQ